MRDVDLIWEQVVVDAHDPVALGRWWAEALGWVVVGDAAAVERTWSTSRVAYEELADAYHAGVDPDGACLASTNWQGHRVPQPDR